MYNLSVQYSSSYLLIVVSGQADVAEFCASTGFLADLARRKSYSRVLLDMLTVDMSVSEADQPAIIEHLKQWAPTAIERLAYVVRPGVGYGILESVCRARGIDSRECHTLNDAEAWLMRA